MNQGQSIKKRYAYQSPRIAPSTSEQRLLKPPPTDQPISSHSHKQEPNGEFLLKQLLSKFQNSQISIWIHVVLGSYFFVSCVL
jgi:hypothetical protein